MIISHADKFVKEERMGVKHSQGLACHLPWHLSASIRAWGRAEVPRWNPTPLTALERPQRGHERPPQDTEIWARPESLFWGVRS